MQPKLQKNVPPGKHVKFSVVADGKDLTYSWSHNDVPLVSNGRVKISQHTDACSILQIEDVQPSDDEGYYACKISNSTGGSVKTKLAQLTTCMISNKFNVISISESAISWCYMYCIGNICSHQYNL